MTRFRSRQFSSNDCRLDLDLLNHRYGRALSGTHGDHSGGLNTISHSTGFLSPTYLPDSSSSGSQSRHLRLGRSLMHLLGRLALLKRLPELEVEGEEERPVNCKKRHGQLGESPAA